MKKIFLSLIAILLLSTSVQAQWTHFGIKVGGGSSTHVDDLTTSGPILGLTLGAWAEYGFTEAEAMYADNFYIQTGLNYIRRGSHFEEVKEFGANFDTRIGFSHAWYLQLPVLACFRYELPIPEADHYITFHAGPAFSFGINGNYREQRINPFKPQDDYNYDTYFSDSPSDRRVFNHFRRPDVNVIFGIGYQHSFFAIDIYVDYGFLATSVDKDLLKTQEQADLEAQNLDSDIRTVAPNGNNCSVMAAFTWRIPIKNREDKDSNKLY